MLSNYVSMCIVLDCIKLKVVHIVFALQTLFYMCTYVCSITIHIPFTINQ